MNQVKLLNLDELATIRREVVIGGKSYEVAEQTVGEMLNRLQLNKQVETSDGSPEQFLTAMRDTAQSILPKAPKKVIDGLNLRQIMALVEFINARDLDEAAQNMKKVAPDDAKQGEATPVEDSGKKS